MLYVKGWFFFLTIAMASLPAGSPVLVTEEYDGIVVTSRFIPFFCKVPSPFVFNVLNLELFKKKLLTMVTGSSSTEIKWDVIKDLPIPAPPGMDFDSFTADVIEVESKIQRYRQLLDEHERQLTTKFTSFFSNQFPKKKPRGT